MSHAILELVHELIIIFALVVGCFVLLRSTLPAARLLAGDIKEICTWWMGRFKKCLLRLVLRILSSVVTALSSVVTALRAQQDECFHASRTWAGTNGHWTRLTCKDCGRVLEKTRRPPLEMIHNVLFAGPHVYVAPLELEVD